jgi:hypothetical protein
LRRRKAGGAIGSLTVGSAAAHWISPCIPKLFEPFTSTGLGLVVFLAASVVSDC